MRFVVELPMVAKGVGEETTAGARLGLGEVVELAEEEEEEDVKEGMEDTVEVEVEVEVEDEPEGLNVEVRRVCERQRKPG
jgi:hypothetical protein